jgi:hypothetical protein
MGDHRRGVFIDHGAAALMGVTPLALDVIRRHVTLQGLRMMELGSQEIMGVPGIPDGTSAKDYFTALGVKHVSVDFNGARGAVVADLGKPAECEAWQGSFDIVTDFGTTEHVHDLYWARRNAHAFAAMDGILLFQNPIIGHWPGHGLHYFTLEFYQRLAEAEVIEIGELFAHPTMGNSETGMQVCCVARKRSEEFVSSERFFKIAEGTILTVACSGEERVMREQIVR